MPDDVAPRSPVRVWSPRTAFDAKTGVRDPCAMRARNQWEQA